MKKISLLTFFLLCMVQVFGQDNKYMIAGTVMDEKGEPLMGVTVNSKDKSVNGAATDLDGKFRIRNISAKTVLNFTFVGYVSQSYLVYKDEEGLKIVMKEKVNEMDEVVVVGHGTQRKITVTGAVTNVDPSLLQAPASSVSNMLGGRVPGIISVTRSGEPGNDFSEFWIRGISTFGANSSALILIDGVEGNLNDLNAADIESFTVLKDASATAVYGTRGANGVVLVTTKTGKAGKLRLNFKINRTFSENGRNPKYVDALDYANLANEARVVRGLDPVYDDVQLHLFKTGLDPDLYPNVNWRNVILKNHTWDSEYYLSASGGGTNATYFFSLGVQDKDAMFNQTKGLNKYDTNVNYHKYTFRTNINSNLTKTTTLNLGFDATIVSQNYPGWATAANTDDLWNSAVTMTPVSAPLVYSTGQLSTIGKTNTTMTPYALLNYTGFRSFSRNTIRLNVGAVQNLDFLLNGLSVEAKFFMNTTTSFTEARTKSPELYHATGRANDGTLMVDKIQDKSDLAYSNSTSYTREYYWEGRTNYSQVFNKVHRVSGLLHYYMQEDINSSVGDPATLKSVPERYQALSGRLTYGYKDTYNVDANFGYTGSENFKPGHQFGFFPAISASWVPTQYEWVQKNIPLFSYFKIRASYGKVGNDRITNDLRFPYLTTVSSTSSSWGNGVSENQVGTDGLVWETALKTDLGLDAKFYKDRFDMTIDYFHDKRSGIFQARNSIPAEAGLVSYPYANVGVMTSEGVDGNITYTQPLAKRTSLTVRANLTYAKNIINHWEDPSVRYPYQSYDNVLYGINRGYVALGLFKDDDDVKSSPVQEVGTNTVAIAPGDIKYKDVNGDGVVNDQDQVPIKYSSTPLVQYGFATELDWHNWTFSAFFEGTAKAQFFYGGNGYYPFNGGETGNVLEIVNNSKNRWTPSSYSGTKDTENPNARFPRLTYGYNANNNVNSTWWLADASYLRLKNVEISYKLDGLWLRKCGLQSATLSLIGENLCVWDNVKLWDPGQATGNGTKYPIQRTYTLQLNVQF